MASLKAANPTQEIVLTAVHAEKEETMKEVRTIMTVALDVPPLANKKFVFEYYDKDSMPGIWEGIPIGYYKVRFRS